MSDQARSRSDLARFTSALPFWMAYGLPILLCYSAMKGGLWLLAVPISTWYLFAMLDAVIGQNKANADLDTSEDEMKWYRLGVMAWAPVQFVTLFWLIWYVTGTVGINYSHELMHQKNRLERWLADALLAMVLYSHFRSEHLQVHHRYVGTPRDTVTARYNEGFHRFYPRVLREGLTSAFQAEAAKLARKDLPWTHSSNPFWTYWYLQAVMLLLAFVLGGWSGLALFLVQAGTAIWQLELVNYVEHYGLTRRHLGSGKYEHVRPHHSWNADQRASNWLLINLQRHSDHHYKPDRRFPVLQTYDTSEAPQLPYGYPVMTVLAMIPPLWRRNMNPRVRAWRQMYYPDITDWAAYNRAANPLPR